MIIENKKGGVLMATSVKVLNEEIRNRYYSKISEFLSNEGEEILQVASNRFAFPIVDSEGNEKFVEITVKVPTGSKDEIYDGYSLNEEFTLKETERKEKAKKQAELKAKKIERDKKMREKQAELRAKREGKK